ncbi:MAG: 50S ribosomal protein L10 [Eubacterium sp.]|nr:50S ribosomal protein L10 [Eubacterium sp.]
MAQVEKKQPIVEEIKGYAADAKGVVLVDYRGLTVEQDTRLRRQLREAGVVYKVYKNTMLHLAFEGTEYDQLDQHLEGPTAIAFGIEDETAPARILNNFAKEAEALEFKGAVVGGTYYDVNGIKELATIPSRDELISKLLGSLQSPITNLARVLKQIAEKDPSEAAAEEKAEEKTEEAAEAPAEEAAAEAPAEEAAAEAPAEDAAGEKAEEAAPATEETAEDAE